MITAQEHRTIIFREIQNFCEFGLYVDETPTDFFTKTSPKRIATRED